MTPPPASRWALRERVKLAEFEGTVVQRWAYSLQIRCDDGTLVSGCTSLIRDRDDELERLADLALE